jgi:hypothetical protein
MKTQISLLMVSLISTSVAFAQGPACVNLSGKYVQTSEKVSYPDGSVENDSPMDTSPYQIDETADCSGATFTSVDSTTAKPVAVTVKFDGNPTNPTPFDNATGNGVTGNLTFYSAYSLTDTGFKIDIECALNNGPINSTGVSSAYILDSTGNLIRTTTYTDGVKISYIYQKTN